MIKYKNFVLMKSFNIDRKMKSRNKKFTKALFWSAECHRPFINKKRKGEIRKNIFVYVRTNMIISTLVFKMSN